MGARFKGYEPRLSSLVNCDQICVMDQGRVVDIAPHAVLLQRCAIYRALWMQQNRHMQDQPQGGAAGGSSGGGAGGPPAFPTGTQP